MKKLDLDVLEMVVAVADTGSFARAATSLHRTPSAVSMQIKTIEEALGKPLFVRTTRNVALTEEGRTLIDYGRRMLAMREEAWSSVVRPEIRGRVTIGVPDDYASSLLPTVLRKFAVAHPRVQVRVIGMPSSALVPLLKDNTLDLACITKTRGITGELIRSEPMVWAAARGNQQIWKERPLPIAVFAPGSTARAHAIGALQQANIKYRMSYESPSLLGLICMVEAGLAVAPLARCSVPAHLAQLGEAEDLPPLAAVEVVLVRSARSARPPCDFLAEQMLADLRS
ncbi:LysR substrate-binding domain-containing protein [Paraburkholderia hospita]|jgi:DNA-binding transcriptional LysR family regulator|uniref:LysR family transcriptional regulator n=1 Tax=Paraburkholderia hospita TaxID=169430 RepID=A0AAJ4SW27_9BURK|nr:LysR substrate-binding domain-containing protein [Paraburkholderia hospita]SKC96019.1 transcriptional regulator, LysR family [Burkholderia sp. CF099]AUT75031.1 LysR family transcriptional regulator [Paraburkholderia hospita]AXF04655.1 LysR family transcriptional regulator [Paraburkholderia hospita]EIN02147.1 LysR family transcriptional regulator [Paraburkholderia hospita]OUL81900.1 LysR family transcriptional regulator [Paraburkholderia hospita]